MGWRYYDPIIGRFMSRDPIGSHGYGYAYNNPLSFRDPSGLDPLGDFAGFLHRLFIPARAAAPRVVAANPFASEVAGTVRWWEHADDAQRWGFVAGILVGVLVGVAFGALCVATFGACVGILALAWVISAGVLAAAASGLAYAAVTRALGGRPTWEGYGHAAFWGGMASGVGFAAGVRVAGVLGLGKGTAAITGKATMGVGDGGDPIPTGANKLTSPAFESERNGIPARFDQGTWEHLVEPRAPGEIPRLQQLQEFYGTDRAGVEQLIDETISNGADLGLGNRAGYIEVQSELSGLRVVLDTNTLGSGYYTIVTAIPPG